MADSFESALSNHTVLVDIGPSFRKMMAAITAVLGLNQWR